MAKKILALILILTMVLTALPACKPKEKEGRQEDEDILEGVQTEVGTLDFSGYRQSEVADIVREVSSEDVVRNKPYVVDDAKVEALIDTLDFALRSTEAKNLLGLDVGALLSKLTDVLYTDRIVNLAVQYLYPLVEKEFAKVWAGLPETLDIEDVETGVAVAPKADVSAVLHIDPIEESLEAIRFYLFPATLAKVLPPEYAAVSEKLKTATTRSKYDPETDVMTTPWADAALLDAEGKLDLPWGVHDRDSFIAAMSAALYGVEPLLLALLANRACDNHGIIGTGDGVAKVVGGVMKLDMQITSIELVLTATANPGYNNTVAPIFEALDVPVTDGNAFTCVRDVVENGLIVPLEALMRTLTQTPVDFLLRALPNLAYAVEAQMVVPLLSMLKTEINYTTNAKYTVQIAGDGEMNDAYKSDEPIRINVGEMIDLAEMGLDISSLNGLLGVAENALGFRLPEINGAGLATLGELTWRDTVRSEAVYAGGEPGKAAYIRANRADVLLFLLEYVLNGLSDRTLLSDILSKLGAADALPELVYTVIDRVIANRNNAVAALTELVIPQDYEEPNSLRWKEAAAPVSPAASLYNEYWTHAKADYMTQNLPSLLDNVLQMTELNIAGITASSLPALLDGLVDSICKAEILNNLAAKIDGLIGKITLPAAVTDLLKAKLGLDLHFWNGYRADFADGDREGFKAAANRLLSPVQKIVTFLLSDGDVTITLTDESGSEVRFLHLHGFDAYAQAVIPLLETLGAKDLPTPAAFKGDPANALGHILDAVFGVIDALKADPYGRLTVLIPNLLCFIRYGGLTGVMDNLLYAVNLALDTVRPIYNLDLYSLTDFDLRFEKTDPIPLLCGLLSGLLRDKLGINLTFDFTTEKLYNDLVTGPVETFVYANGNTGYRVNEAGLDKANMLTPIYDYLLKTLLFSDATPTLLQFAKEKLNLSDSVFSYVEKILPALQNAEQNYPGSAKALIFWVFYAAEALVGAMGGSSSPDVLTIISTLMGSGSAAKRDFARAELQNDITKPGFSDILRGILQALFS